MTVFRAITKNDGEDSAKLDQVLQRIQSSEASNDSVERIEKWAVQLQADQVDTRPDRLISSKGYWFSMVTAASFIVLLGVVTVMSGRDRAVAQMQRAIRSVDEFTLNGFMGIGDQRRFVESISVNGNLIRWDRSDGLVRITDMEQKTEVELNPRRESVEYYPLYDLSQQRQSLDRIFRLMSELPQHAFRKVLDETKNSYVFEWESQIIALWIDTSTSLPSRIEFRKASGDWAGLNGMSADFSYDSVPQDRFVLRFPDNYKVVRIDRSQSIDSRRLNLIPGQGVDGLAFRSSLGEVYKFFGPPEGVKHFTRVVSMTNQIQTEVGSDAQKSEMEVDIALNAEANDVPFTRVEELIYDSRGFRVIFDEINGFEQITVQNDGAYGGRSVGFNGTVAGAIRLGDSAELVREKFGEPDNNSGLNDAPWNGGLVYWDPFVQFRFRDRKLTSVTIAEYGFEIKTVSDGNGGFNRAWVTRMPR
ncbi:hypothetical protein SH501x_004510 [Pirellulaceae bacterium SH501]